MCQHQNMIQGRAKMSRSKKLRRWKLNEIGLRGQQRTSRGPRDQRSRGGSRPGCFRVPVTDYIRNLMLTDILVIYVNCLLNRHFHLMGIWDFNQISMLSKPWWLHLLLRLSQSTINASTSARVVTRCTLSARITLWSKNRYQAMFVTTMILPK